ncbi:cysteine-rich CWC family protein [Undibacterium sp. MH2W]|uniref:cysteine-rich CWC family protein n=1 Tax=Undibacterium sp. MH2W TaxID=3413044 RepID=UPI003BF12968
MSVCQRCRQEFVCAVADNKGEACWCMALPVVDVTLVPQEHATTEVTCLCPACLSACKRPVIGVDSKL